MTNEALDFAALFLIWAISVSLVVRFILKRCPI